MGKKLVRQFKTHNAPAGSRGYRSQATVEYPPLNPPAAVVDYGVPSIDHGVRQRPPAPPTPPVVDLSMIPEIPMLVPYPPTTAQIPRTMGTPALPPDWYPETPNRIWSPQQQPTTNPRLRRNTGEGDLPINVPRVNLPTTTLPPQRPTSPYTQPNVGVDITPEQFTLPPQQQQIIRERPTTIDYGPITTPIERPIQEDAGYIEPQQLYPLTPGPQITATEQSFYEPQPVEGAYAYPIQADYPQPQTQPQTQPQNPDLNQDEITNLIDTLIPEQQEAKTIQMHEEGPQWVEDPYALAAQEAIDQAPFNQTDPSIYYRPPEIDEAPEIILADQPQQQDPFVIDYGPTYGEPAVQETAQAPYLPPEQPVQQLPITQPPELGMPEIPQQPDPVGGVRAEDDFFREDYHRDTDLKVGRGNIDEYVGGPIERDPEGAAAIVEAEKPVRQRKEGPEFLVDPIIDDKEEFKGGPTVTAGVTGEVDTGEDEGGRGTITVQETADTGQSQPEIPSHREPTFGGQEKTQTQASLTSTPGQGGRRWLHTGPQDFADALHQFRINRGTTQGPPIVTDTPAVSGPQVNRETGEITEKPLTWYQFEPSGSSVSPYDATTVGGTTDTTGTADIGRSGGLLTGGFDSTQIAELAGGSITPVLDYLHPGATSDGQTVTFKDIGSVDDWIDGVIDLDPTLKGLKDLGYEKRDAEGNRVGWGNHALDGFNQLTGAINNVFDFMGDPSKGKFTAAILEDFGMMPTKGGSLKEMASNFNKFHEETSQMWETSQDKAWGRKWNDLTQTQEYGDMQPLGIFALLTNPPAALAMTANSLLYDFKNAAQGMFDANPNYKGNMAQDVLNGAFHFLGKAAKKVGSLFGKLGKTVGSKLGKGSGDKQEFTDKDVKLDPMEVSRQLLYTSKQEWEGTNPTTMEEWKGYRKTSDVRYELVKTLLENGVDVRFHNNAISFDKGIADARIDRIKTTIDDLGLNASNLEIMAGTDGLDDFPELKAWLEALADQWRKAAKS